MELELLYKQLVNTAAHISESRGYSTDDFTQSHIKPIINGR